MEGDGWQNLSIDAIKAKTEGAIAIGPFGSRMKSDLYVSDGVPIIRGNNISDTRELVGEFVFVSPETADGLRSSNVFPDDLVFPHRGAIGQVGIVPRNGERRYVLSTSLMKLTCDRSQVDPKYVFYFFRSPHGRHELLKHASTVGTPGIGQPLSSLRSIALPIPSLPEQRAIAHILGTLDDKIELNRRMNEALEAIARALFKSWFVDFDPVRAKAQGCDPGLPQPLADLFPDSFEDSELGEIPRGWEVKMLSDLCSTQYGYTASAVDEPVGPKFLRVTDINKRNWIEWGDVPHCAIEPDARASYTLQVGDLVVARMADPGKSAIIEDEIDAVFASYLVRLTTPSLAHSYYVYGFLKSDLYAEYSEGAKSGSVQANMNAKVIVGASLVVPPKGLMEHFFRVVLPLRQRLVTNVCESRTLAALRDTLLPKLISGELRVPDAERLAARYT
jgi:type I restriction enzyme S subunit